MTAPPGQLAALELRARLAALRPADVGAGGERWFERWLDGVPGPGAGRSDADFRVTVDPAVRTIAFAAQHDVDVALPAIATLLGESGAPPSSWAEVRDAVAQLGAERVGWWLRFAPAGPALGWSALGSWSLAQVRELAGAHGDAWDRLSEWAGADAEVRAAGADVGAEQPAWTIALALGAGSHRDVLEAAAPAFETLGVTTLPTELADAFGPEDPTGPGRLSATLAPAGAVRVAAELPGPLATTRRGLIELAGAEDPLELARVEGALGEPPCERVAFVVDADGFSIALTYAAT